MSDINSLQIQGKTATVEFSCRRKAAEKTCLTFKAVLDFTGDSDKQILDWAVSTKRKDLQRALRQCPPELFRQLSMDVIRRPANKAGMKFLTSEEANALKESSKAQIENMTAEERKALLDHFNSLQIQEKPETVEFRCSQAKGKPLLTFKAGLDFAGVSEEQILDWAVQNRVIALQNALRQCPPELFRQLSMDVIRRPANKAGVKFDTVEELKRSWNR